MVNDAGNSGFLTGKALVDYVQYTQWLGAGGGIENKLHSTNVQSVNRVPASV